MRLCILSGTRKLYSHAYCCGVLARKLFFCLHPSSRFQEFRLRRQFCKPFSNHFRHFRSPFGTQMGIVRLAVRVVLIQSRRKIHEKTFGCFISNTRQPTHRGRSHVNAGNLEFLSDSLHGDRIIAMGILQDQGTVNRQEPTAGDGSHEVRHCPMVANRSDH